MSINSEKAGGDQSNNNGLSPPVETCIIFAGDSVDPIYQMKAQILNDAIQDIGMGRYQVRAPLFLQRDLQLIFS